MTEPMPLAFLRDHLELIRHNAKLNELKKAELDEMDRISKLIDEAKERFRSERSAVWVQVAEYAQRHNIAPLGFQYDGRDIRKSSHALFMDKGVLYATKVDSKTTNARSIIDMLFNLGEPT